MSNYLMPTKHPRTGEFELAEWLDDYYGPHRYGVRFPSDKKVYNADKIRLETTSDISVFEKEKEVERIE